MSPSTDFESAASAASPLETSRLASGSSPVCPSCARRTCRLTSKGGATGRNCKANRSALRRQCPPVACSQSFEPCEFRVDFLARLFGLRDLRARCRGNPQRADCLGEATKSGFAALLCGVWHNCPLGSGDESPLLGKDSVALDNVRRGNNQERERVPVARVAMLHPGKVLGAAVKLGDKVGAQPRRRFGRGARHFGHGLTSSNGTVGSGEL